MYAEGNEDAKDILIEHNLRLVAYVAKKYNNHAKDAEDLISVGTFSSVVNHTQKNLVVQAFSGVFPIYSTTDIFNEVVQNGEKRS
ncbi:MAG: hypothetical protein FWE27_07700 [Defluviitaleaceae bacterium]|nr:hypothetical protein [Defluviitaleaceae bacterium]